MASSLTVHGKAVPVSVGPGVSAERARLALDSSIVREWCDGLDAELDVRSVALTDVDLFGPRVGFVKLTAEAYMDGVRLPGIVFLRGGAVAMLIILRCGGERWVVCCRQPRVPCGRASFLEIPAGMLDGSGHFAGVAAKEIQEETGLTFGESELTDMTTLAYGHGGDLRGHRGWYPSVGACDEFLRLLVATRDVGSDELAALRGKATGLREHGEVIVLELVPLGDLWRATPDGKTLAALYLYDKLVASGELLKA